MQKGVTTVARLKPGTRFYPAAKQGWYDVWVVTGTKRLSNGLIRVGFKSEQDPSAYIADDWRPNKQVEIVAGMELSASAAAQIVRAAT